MSESNEDPLIVEVRAINHHLNRLAVVLETLLKRTEPFNVYAKVDIENPVSTDD